MIRLFLGLDLPPDCRGRLAAACSGLPGVRWIRPENFHITLRFIGEVDETRAEEIAESMSRLSHPAVDVAISNLGVSGGSHRAHTLWAEVEATPPLRDLQTRVERLVVAAGCPPEPRRFHPHVTLAKVKNAPHERLQDFVHANSLAARCAFTADAVILFSSLLSRDGSLYTEEMRFPLAAV